MAFVGMNIAIRMLCLPQIKDHWSISQILSMPWLPSIMGFVFYNTTMPPLGGLLCTGTKERRIRI